MSELSSQRPNFQLYINEHDYCRSGVQAALTALKSDSSPEGVALAAEQLFDYQAQLPDSYAQVAAAHIDAGQIDQWIETFIHEDERALQRMFEDLYLGDSVYTDDDPYVVRYFSQTPDDHLHRLALEHMADINTAEPELIPGIGGYITPPHAGTDALRYEYAFKINTAIEKFIDTLPESSQQAIAQELQVRQFRDLLGHIESPLEIEKMINENLNDSQLVMRLLQDSVENPVLSDALNDYEVAKTNFATTLEQISTTSSVKVTVRRSLYRDVRENVKSVAYQFNNLCDTLNDTYGDKKTASRMMATLWRQDKEMFHSIINSLSNGQDEYAGTLDTAIDIYADLFMEAPLSPEIDFGNQLPSKIDVINQYADDLHILTEKVKRIQA